MWSLRGLAVDDGFRRLGLGRRLVDAGVELAASRGARRVRSRVLASNAASLHLHRACGFAVEGVLVGEFRIAGADVDDVLLARRIDCVDD